MVFLNGAAIPEPDRRGTRIVDDSFLVAFNGHHEAIEFELPSIEYGQGWVPELDTTEAFVRVEVPEIAAEAGTGLKPGSSLPVGPRSVVVLRAPRPTP
jgi:glycogen operon protein